MFDFLKHCIKGAFSGSNLYWGWLVGLTFLASMGFFTYLNQLEQGLVISGMSDQVSWGIYVANFTYLVGVAAAAVMLVIPAYIFQDPAAKKVVIIGEGLAVSACIMAMLFVTVDMGHPERAWHMIPGIGILNFPSSLLAWDVLVLTGYLLLNLFIPAYLLYHQFHKTPYNKKLVFSAAVFSIFWAIALHVVTAFLFASNTSRPFWNSALTAPRFLASAFTSGPACIIIAFILMKKRKMFVIKHKVIDMLAVIVAIAMQINLVMLASEFFTEFYNEKVHSASARYLFAGLDGANGLVPWIYTAIVCNLIAVALLMIKKTRMQDKYLAVACILAIFGVWVEKGMGFVIPGFIPTPLGEVFEYTPSLAEIQISIGIFAIGMIVFSIMTKGIIAVQRFSAEDHATIHSNQETNSTAKE